MKIYLSAMVIILLFPSCEGQPIGRGEKKTHPIYMREGNPTLIPLVRGVPIGRGEKKE
jgi:hypothetical protein